MHISLVTDSTADIPDELVETHNIHVVSNLIILDDRSYEDSKAFSRQEYYRRLPKFENLPTTSTAPLGIYQQLYEKLLKEGADHILSIHASSLLSGIYNTAWSAGRQFESRVTAIDSESVSLGLGFQVLAAAEAIRDGFPLEAIQKIIRDVRCRIHLVAMLDTLDYIRRSGRVSWARARIGNLLRLKPFIEIKNGKAIRLGEARTRKKGMERLKQFLSDLGDLERLALLHTNAEEDARKILDGLQLNLSLPPFIVNVTTVIGTHVGPNGLGFVAMVK